LAICNRVICDFEAPHERSIYKLEITNHKFQDGRRNFGANEKLEEKIMAVSRAKKNEQVEKLTEELKNVSNLVVTTYTKMTVNQDFELRKALRGAGAKYQVVKNTLAEKAAKGTKVEGALKDLAGVTSIAYTTGDPVAMAKALQKYAKDTPEFTFKSGVVEGRVISIKEIDALASMPSKEELYAKLLFMLNAPAQRLVTVMGAVSRDLAVVVDQGVKEKKFKEA
jgi:large subunit ribosomal protein L10